MKKQLLFVLFIFTCQLLISQTNSIPKQPEPVSNDPAKVEHYEYLKEEMKNFREFVQQEREQNQNFLLWTLAIVGTILSFFGWRTYSDIKNSSAKLVKETKKQIDDKLNAARKDFEQEIQSIFSSDPYLKEAQKGFEKYTQMVRQRMDVESGKYLLLVDQKKKKGMLENEVPAFERAINRPDIETDLSGVHLDEYDVIIYRSNVDKDGEDAFLKSSLFPQLIEMKEEGVIFPVVIYTKEKINYEGPTFKAINDFQFATIANHTTTLIDNTASAFRVAKLMEGKSR